MSNSMSLSDSNLATINTKPCMICGSTTRELLSREGRGGQKLDTVICTGCGLVHSHPIPTLADLDQFYAEKYRHNYKATHKPRLKHTLRYAKDAQAWVLEILHFIQPHQRDLLDVGSGSGEFLYLACHMGLRGRGIEPHHGYATYTQQDLGLNVENTTLEKAAVMPASQDVITLHHVLEHMPDPVATLKYLHSLLRDQGLLIIDVPDISKCRHAPQTQFHFAHIYNFNDQTLKAAVQKAGFVLVNPDVTTTHIVARKVLNQPVDASHPINLSNNYHQLATTLTTHTVTRHYTSVRPYARLLRKLYQYPKEILLTKLYRSPTEILNRFVKKV